MKKFLIAILVIGIASSVSYIFIQKNKYEEELMNRDSKITELQQNLDAFGTDVTVYTVAGAIKSGEVFDQSKVMPITIPSAMLTEAYITDLTALENQFYKVDVEPGTPIITSMFTPENISPTDRMVDIVLDQYTIERREGEYYDIRYQDQNGNDYIVLSKKRLYKDYGTVLNFKLNEKELQLYNSALIDRYLDPSGLLYMTKYVEPALQEQAIEYYSPRENIITIMEQNPNKIQMAKDEMIARRKAIDANLQLPGVRDFEKVEDYFKQITLGRTWYQEKIQSAINPEDENSEDGTGEGYVDPYENLTDKEGLEEGGQAALDSAQSSVEEGKDAGLELNP